MGHRHFYYRWEWLCRSSPQALWPFISDTNRFNRDVGIPSVERLQSSEKSIPTANRRLRLRFMGMTVEWEEEPFEWVCPYRFGITRRYLKGPIAELKTLVEFVAKSDHQTQLIFQVWVIPKNLIGVVSIPLQIGLISANKFASVIRKYDDLAFRKKSILESKETVHFASGGRTRLNTLCKDLIAKGGVQSLVTRLAEVIESADDLTISRLRPYVLADAWGVDRREVLKLCLLATRSGLLDFRWDVLCPFCRGSQSASSTLREIHTQVHCDSCNIDFIANFDRSVEFTFHPNLSIREFKVYEFCVGGPQITPHIMAQQWILPNKGQVLKIPLEEGTYRLRAPTLPGNQFLRISKGGSAEGVIRANANGWGQEEQHLNTDPTLQLENNSNNKQLFILERLAWSDQIVTAVEVTALQLFRDLFANEVLRPGDQISVGSVTILFTDLRNSTKLYRKIGDAPAFGKVMGHFDVLRKALLEEDGALVKTIGDAVMGVFRRPVLALKAALKAQQQLASSFEDSEPLMLKIGIHHGACIAVNLNERLDYFGSTVNVAARLVGLSSGQDAIISEAVYADPEVANYLRQFNEGLAIESVNETLKGFDDTQFKIWRISPNTLLEN